jgi:hypothetical protein
VGQQAERKAAIELIAERRTPAQALQVVRHAEWFAAQLVDAREIACRDRGAWCCSLLVSASAPEILQAAEYLRAQRSAEDFAALRIALNTLDAAALRIALKP